ncbi:MAG: RsmB/NOP family class I SAM-dependent RNA methyltransferase [Candidatus Omnitrophota bacterium]|nr:RsmB/NOP family class I SAM-dependent RNA methyltransferase [Candidatus Omnitrophota bacterium]
MKQFFLQHRKKFGSRDRRFLSEVIFSLYRHKTFIDIWTEKLLGNSSSEEDRDGAMLALAAVLAGILDKEGAQAVLPDGFKSEERIKAHDLPEDISFESEVDAAAARYSFPDWLVKRWFEQFGNAPAVALLCSLNQRPPLVGRVNPSKMSRDELLARFQSKGISVEASKRSDCGVVFRNRIHLLSTEEFQKGYVEIQDEGSQLITQAVGPRAGEWVWDACAGGGGKALLAAALMENKGCVVASDIREGKLRDLEKRAKRAGATNIRIVVPDRLDEITEIRDGFDKIMIDVPCSGTGTIRRNPDLKWRLQEKDFESYPERQLDIIEKALPRLKKGGKLYYITCSLDRAENEGVVEKLLAGGDGLEPDGDVVPILENCKTGEGQYRLMPHEQSTDGFFLAVFRKRPA